MPVLNREFTQKVLDTARSRHTDDVTHQLSSVYGAEAFADELESAATVLGLIIHASQHLDPESLGHYVKSTATALINKEVDRLMQEGPTDGDYEDTWGKSKLSRF